MTIRTLLVDDEDLARRGLRTRLERATDIEIIGECVNGTEAIEAIGRTSPDLVFLDVRMPEASGFDVVQALGGETVPYIIFLTAFDEYAINAFEVHALDYLLKPVDDKRLELALTQARSALLARRDGSFGRHVAEAVADWERSGIAVTPRTASERIAVPTAEGVTVIRVTDINWVEAAGNYVSLHTDRKSWLLRETIATLDHRLASQGFARIHRSALVNLDRVVELRTLGGGDYTVILRDGTELKLTRSHRACVWKLLGGELPGED